MMKNKTFDCVEMKRRGAEYVYSLTKDMSRQEEIEFWRKRSQEFMHQQERLRAQQVPTPTAQNTGTGE